ncbi:E3 ubiquitin-protein ligase TRAF7-like [Dysidea avara]|uniref:E3 ubiquitin-protein ligase TRAF7-like n=1 Tax=Dysidea avara TaxID=196820 RepID=UPI003327622F
MEVLADIRARGDGDSVSSVSVKSPATSSHMNNFDYKVDEATPPVAKRSASFSALPGQSPVERPYIHRGHVRTQSNASSVSHSSYWNSPSMYSSEKEKSIRQYINLHSSTIGGSNHSLFKQSSSPVKEIKEIVLLAEEASPKLYCPLCKKVFSDPHITTCGHTFCRSCVISSKHGFCPLDNTQLSLVVANIAVADQVGELSIHCCYGCRPKPDNSGVYEVNPSGCPVIIKLANRHEHEEKCDYTPVQCPNSSKCPVLLKKDLQEHLTKCYRVRCPHKKYNCTFEGSHDELSAHLETCSYEQLKGFLGRTDDHIQQLQDELKKKDEEIEFLRSMLAQLSDKVDMMDKATVDRLGSFENIQSNVQQDVEEASQGISFVLNELRLLQDQLGVTGTLDNQHLYRCKGTFVGHDGPIWALVLAGEFLFSGSSDNTIKVWDVAQSFKCVKTLTGHESTVLALCNHGDNMYSGSADQTIKVWNIKTLEVVDTIKAHDNHVCTLACSGNLLFSGSLKSIKVWDLLTHKLVSDLHGENHWVRALKACGNFLYSGSYKTIKIWDLNSFECVHIMEPHGGSVYSLAVTNQYIICGTYENNINVWKVENLQPVGTLEGHVGTVYGLTVIETPGNIRLVSASYDKTLRVWNIEHMRCVQTLIRHEGSVSCLTVSRGRLFSGAVDSTIKVWQ